VTFSLTARCPRTGAFGIAISSSSPAVAARCLHLRPGVGAAASQNITDPRLGTRLLDLLATGLTAETAMAAVVAADPTAEYRQLAVVDARGGVAVHSGRHTLGVHHSALGDGAIAAGNLLATSAVIDSVLHAYSRSKQDDLAARLLDGLYAGLAAGGEAGPVHSAGLAVTHPSAGWAETDLRVDWHDDPLGELRLLWQRWQPVREDYITRGLHPASAPAYGVPGDEALSLEEAQDPGLGDRQPVPQARSARRSG
jgi:uncharacterized Ntn-hydrolase superfamily protein